MEVTHQAKAIAVLSLISPQRKAVMNIAAALTGFALALQMKVSCSD